MVTPPYIFVGRSFKQEMNQLLLSLLKLDLLERMIHPEFLKFFGQPHQEQSKGVNLLHGTALSLWLSQTWEREGREGGREGGSQERKEGVREGGRGKEEWGREGVGRKGVSEGGRMGGRGKGREGGREGECVMKFTICSSSCTCKTIFTVSLFYSVSLPFSSSRPNNFMNDRVSLTFVYWRTPIPIRPISIELEGHRYTKLLIMCGVVDWL